MAEGMDHGSRDRLVGALDDIGEPVLLAEMDDSYVGLTGEWLENERCIHGWSGLGLSYATGGVGSSLRRPSDPVVDMFDIEMDLGG